MNRLIMPGGVALLMTFVVGLWLVISPLVMKAQAAGASWSAATINNVAVGGLLTTVALCGFCLTLGLGLRDLIHAAGQRSEQTPGESAT
jgi:hypothetical protein